MNLKLRYWLFFVIDSLIVLTAIFISHWLVNDSATLNSIIAISSVTLLITHHLTAKLFHLYNRIWSVASVNELLNIGYLVTICILITSLVQFIIQGGIYFKIMFITWLLHIMLIGGSRFFLRLFHDYRSIVKPQHNIKRVLIVGAGEAGTLLVRSIKRNVKPEYLVVGIVDDNPNKQNLTLMDVKVCGTTKDIPKLVLELAIDEIILAIPSLEKAEMSKLYAHCANTNATIKTMPKIEDIVMGKSKVHDIQEINFEHLLGREEVKLNMEAISNKLLNKVILVTGAGGSIGSEICRQVVQFQPKEIILLGHGENSIYNIHMELLEKVGEKQIHLLPVIADIQDREKIFEVVEHYRPDFIYHAAAHKHVPLMEYNPREAVKNNIFGTKNVAEAAHTYHVENFVMISSDKAVNPTNVMGATKRIAEMIIQNLAIHSDTNFAAVRFGNVLGSRGSVVPRFNKQIITGGPVTVTHPDMTRYFMTIPEASRLVIQAGALAQGGEVFVLDMGEPIKIVDLAKNLIKLCGYTEKDIDIQYSGIRPGEKLYEELLNEEEIQEQHVYPKIHVGKAHAMKEDLLAQLLNELERLEVSEMKAKVIDVANGKWTNTKLHPRTIA